MPCAAAVAAPGHPDRRASQLSGGGGAAIPPPWAACSASLGTYARAARARMPSATLSSWRHECCSVLCGCGIETSGNRLASRARAKGTSQLIWVGALSCEILHLRTQQGCHGLTLTSSAGLNCHALGAGAGPYGRGVLTIHARPV